MLVFVLGTIFMRSAGCCLNDVADKDFDRHVKRTASRPVTSGRLSTREALGVALVFLALSFALVCTLNSASIAWSFVALGVTVLYPYAKRFVSMPQAVLGIAFSFGIPMAYAAVLGEGVGWQQFLEVMPSKAYLLLLSNLAWVLAYDTQYAMVDRDDDLKIGMKTSAITLGDWDVSAIMIFYAVYLLSWTGLVQDQQFSWPFYGCMVLAALQAIAHYFWIKDRTREGCFRAFRLNHWLGATVFLGVALGFTFP
jgi:4-hydroxybenzoate polyprenyltransferase